eukprot:3791029-Rhodomonas_salina.2
MPPYHLLLSFTPLPLFPPSCSSLAPRMPVRELRDPSLRMYASLFGATFQNNRLLNRRKEEVHLYRCCPADRTDVQIRCMVPVQTSQICDLWVVADW